MARKVVRDRPQHVGEKTKRAIVEAALKALREVGFSRASARAIARLGGFNQALIFYHFGGVNRLLLAALDQTSAARMERYRQALEGVRSLEGLLEVARRTYREDLEGGHMTVVAEMIAGSVADPELRPEIASRIRLWVSFVDEVLNRFLRDSPLGTLVTSSDVSSALVAFYLGLNISSRLEDDQSWVGNLFEAAERLPPLLAPFVTRT